MLLFDVLPTSLLPMTKMKFIWLIDSFFLNLAMNKKKMVGLMTFLLKCNSP